MAWTGLDPDGPGLPPAFTAFSIPTSGYLLNLSLSLKSSSVKWKKLWCHPSRILSSLSELKACEMLSITRGA